MRFARLREIFGALHFRLTMWNTVTVLFMVIVTLLGVREALRLALLHESDQLLADDAAEVGLIVKEFLPDTEQIERELERKASTHAHRGLFIELVDPSGRVVWRSQSAPEDPSLRRITLDRPVSRANYRVLERNLPRPVAGARIMRLGSSLEPILADVEKLTQLMLSVGVLIMLVSPLGGYWLASRATRPLARIIDTTARLHPSKLDERLHIRGTRDELDRLSLTVNGLLDRIAAYLEQNRQFTANAAHELRSPLAAIQSSLEVALETERTKAEYAELIGETLEECGALRDLVNQLLLLAESDAGRIDISPEALRLDRVIQKAHDMFAGVAEAAGAHLTIRRLDAVLVYGDANRLRQVINNLLDNAIKFSAGGGKIDITLAAEPFSRRIRLDVSDTGHGIPAEDLPHVFERFYQADKSRQRTGRTGGTGLGLSICKSIINAHGGTIEIDSELGRGTTVTVKLSSAEVSGPEELGLPLTPIEASGIS